MVQLFVFGFKQVGDVHAYSANTYSVCGILMIVLGAVLALLGLILLLAVPVAGIIAVVVGVACVVIGRKYRKVAKERRANE